MKKDYETPFVEVEHYTLSMSIASNCTTVVSNGPAMGEHVQCNDYEDPFGEPEFAFFSARKKNVNFYEDSNCDCY